MSRIFALLLSLLALGFSASAQEFVPVQISFVPGIALPFGYYDVGFAAAAIGNLTRDVEGGAAAGVFNLNRRVSGLSLAGVFNIASEVDGMQAAGVFNLSSGEVSGAQVSGVFGIAEGRIEGFQSAGVFNIAKDGISGMQLGGVFNVSGRSAEGGQMSGLFSISEGSAGPIQLSGLFGIAERIEGLQASGLFNIAQDSSGLQVAPFFNVADRVRGVQIGIVNVAGRLDGIQIGLLNIAKTGVSGSGVFYEGASGYDWFYWQNGSPFLYTILMAGQPFDDLFSRGDRLLLSAGFGSRMSLGGQRYGRPWIDWEVAATSDIGRATSSFAGDFASIAVTPATWFSGAVPDMFDRAGALLPDRPWPTLRFSIGMPLLGRFAVIAGFRFDFAVAGWRDLPDSVKRGIVLGSPDWLGLDYDCYAKWFLGFRI